MPYNSATDSFRTKKLCSRVTSILDENQPFYVFEPPLRGLKATYNDHLRLIGKRSGLPISVN